MKIAPNGNHYMNSDGLCAGWETMSCSSGFSWSYFYLFPFSCCLSCFILGAFIPWATIIIFQWFRKEKKITQLTFIHTHTHTHTSIAALFTTAKRWKQPTCSLTDNWINTVWYIHTMENYSASKKERNSDICHNMDEPQGHYAKWKKHTQKYCIIPLRWSI